MRGAAALAAGDVVALLALEEVLDELVHLVVLELRLEPLDVGQREGAVALRLLQPLGELGGGLALLLDALLDRLGSPAKMEGDDGEMTAR